MNIRTISNWQTALAVVVVVVAVIWTLVTNDRNRNPCDSTHPSVTCTDIPPTAEN